MSDSLVQEQPTVVNVDLSTVIDAINAEDMANESRYDAIDSKLDALALQSQSESSTQTVEVDAEQWDSMAATLNECRDIGSLSLFLVLLLVCVASAILGSRLFGIFTEGWRK